MNNTYIKQGIELATMNKVFDSQIDKLIVSCLLYDYIVRVLSKQSGFQNNSMELAKSYLDLFINDFIIYKDSAVSYTLIRKKIEATKKNSIIEFYDDEIRDIVNLYNDKTAVKTFSTTSFSQYMYRVLQLSNKEYKFLSNIHKNIMIPIAKFYKNLYDIEDKNLEIYSAQEYSGLSGKEILFLIRGIDTTKIVSDINTKRIPLGNKVYRCKADGLFVNILVN